MNVSSDEAFEARVSAYIEYYFGGPSKTMDKNKVAELPVIKALSSRPNYCADRVHDDSRPGYILLICVLMNKG